MFFAILRFYVFFFFFNFVKRLMFVATATASDSQYSNRVILIDCLIERFTFLWGYRLTKRSAGASWHIKFREFISVFVILTSFLLFLCTGGVKILNFLLNDWTKRTSTCSGWNWAPLRGGHIIEGFVFLV